MTITTDQGAPIVVSLDLTRAPCSGEDLTYLAGKKFYDNTACTEITTDGALRCGDPKGNGLGGPTYSIYNENAPSAPTPSASAAPAPGAAPLYPKGTVALIGNPPGTNGSQFLLFFKDASPANPQYSIVGTITSGMDTLTKISKIPTVANTAGDKVTPKTKITIRDVDRRRRGSGRRTGRQQPAVSLEEPSHIAGGTPCRRSRTGSARRRGPASRRRWPSGPRRRASAVSVRR